jgi:hypothetical protein
MGAAAVAAVQQTIESERMNMDRVFFDFLDYGECHVALIDALRDYIRCNESIGRDLLNDGSITLDEFKIADVRIARFKNLLHEIEETNFDPSLCGVIQRKEKSK